MHRIKYTAVYGFKSVPYVGNGAGNVYRHCVGDERFFKLGFDFDVEHFCHFESFFEFFGEFGTRYFFSHTIFPYFLFLKINYDEKRKGGFTSPVKRFCDNSNLTENICSAKIFVNFFSVV